MHFLKINHYSKALYIVIFIVFMSCTSKKYTSPLKEGDILFRGNNKTGLSEAINGVTQTSSRTNYTHMGICKISNNSILVLHASAEKGVCAESLKDFTIPNGDSSYITDVYRLKYQYTGAIDVALKRAHKLIGHPYDETYILDSPGYYCSEFIQHIFENDSIFSLQAMTFIDPSTGKYHKGWLEHYNTLGLNIPEGLLGCNPNEMATEGKLEFLKRL